MRLTPLPMAPVVVDAECSVPLIVVADPLLATVDPLMESKDRYTAASVGNPDCH